MLALLAPGQGAQKPGFLTPWLELDSFATRIAEYSEITGLDLKFLGTEADAETIKDTKIAQPLLVGAALASALELFGSLEALQEKTTLVAGHSVGEIAAAGLAGVLSERDCMVFVRERGTAMAEAAQISETSMTAVLSGDPQEVLAAIENCGLTAANHNGAGQIVAAGTISQLAELAANPPARARLAPLSVAGAFHTEHMRPAVAKLAELANTQIKPSAAKIKLLSNRDGAAVDSGSEYLNRLVDQVANPVRWDQCMETMANLGVTGVLELTPAGTLTGIVRRNIKDAARFNLNTPDDLEAARDFVANHSESLTAK